MTAPVTFEVLGTPTPQGSKTRMPNGAMLEGRSAGQRAMHRSWRTAVAEAARDVAEGAPPLTGPLVLEVEFRCQMPKSRKAAVRAAGRGPKVSAPDLDKLVRSVGDALTEGGLIADDALFCDIFASKREVVGWTGAIITVREWAVDA